ncbi:MAG: hypothetical protein HY814_11125 [Candidatus Riflebacteria bacterium]|nr:hypothetical protein [Candidatus Riflebacteria bacterium]
MLGKFQYGVGDDPRNKNTAHGGLGLKTGGAEFGFDLSYANTRWNLANTDFVNDAAQNDLPASGSYVYAADRITDWGPFTNGVVFDVENGSSVPAFNATSSVSAIGPDVAKWARVDWAAVSNAQAKQYENVNYRVTEYDIKDIEMPMPIFLNNAASITSTIGAESLDRTVTAAITTPGVASRQRKSGPTGIGSVAIQDGDPPNVSIEVVEFKEGTPVVFVASTDFGRDWSNSPLDLVGAWQCFKASADSRKAYDATPSERRAAQVTLPTGSANRMNQTTVMDFRAPTFVPPGTSLNYRIEEDVRFRVTARACDNGSSAQNIKLTIKGEDSEGSVQNPFPKAEKLLGSVGIDAGGIAMVQGTHFYSRAGEDDVIHVTAEDLNGNRREVVLHLDVGAHPTDYRIIGDGVRKQ